MQAQVQAKVKAQAEARAKAKAQAEERARAQARARARTQSPSQPQTTGASLQGNITIKIESIEQKIPTNLSISDQKKALIINTDKIISQLTGKEEKYIQINETTKKEQGITISVGTKQILIPFRLSNNSKKQKIREIANEITLQKFSNTTELESFGNTPILEPFWNKPILEPFWNDEQTRTEAIQNAEAINNNMLPIGIYSSNCVSMYASIRY
jgi:hypothetical protein